MKIIRYFETPKQASEFIHNYHRKLHGNKPLAFGVGNDMSYPFYHYSNNGDGYLYWTNGINGDVIECACHVTRGDRALGLK